MSHDYICEECWIPLEHGATRCPNCTVPTLFSESKGAYLIIVLAVAGMAILLTQ